MKSQILNGKPLRLWEWREYKNGSLIENGIALNETGTFVWKLCNGKNTVDKIISAVISRHNVEKQKAAKDVQELVKLLIKENALSLNK